MSAVTRVRTLDFGEPLNASPDLGSAWMSLAPTVAAFRRHYRRWGYREQPPVPLVSDVDPTVRFVGSTISVLKPYVLQASIPWPGIFLVQPALRTRNLARLLDQQARLSSPSFFLHLGTVSPPDCLELTALHAWTFLRATTVDRRTRAVMRVSSQDRDLLAITRRLPDPEVEIDGEDPARYRHGFGLEGIVGRNLNWGVRRPDGAIDDVGNLVVIEDRRGPRAVEVAVGLNHLAARLFELDHPILASPVAAAVPITSDCGVKLADALAASTALVDAGLRPTGRGRGRVLRGYLHALAALRDACGRSNDDVERAIAYLLTGPESGAVASAIRRYLEVYERLATSERRSEAHALALREFTLHLR
jgi:hypothetical protein